MLKVISGDFMRAKFKSGFLLSRGVLMFPTAWWNPFLSKYPPDRIAEIRQITEENRKDFLGAAGWAAAGGLALGPLGLLAGAVFGGRHKAIFFAVRLNDGRRAVIQTSPKTWAAIMATYI